MLERKKERSLLTFQCSLNEYKIYSLRGIGSPGHVKEVVARPLQVVLRRA